MSSANGGAATMGAIVRPPLMADAAPPDVLVSEPQEATARADESATIYENDSGVAAAVRSGSARVAARPTVTAVDQRDVLIRATPGSALVSVDGQAPVKVGFGVQMRLPVGSHSLVFSTPSGDPCCQPRTVQVEVQQGEGTQVISGAVHYRDARLSLVGGPPDARLDCPAIGKTVAAGSSVSVKMASVDLFVTCFISGSGLTPDSRSITLRAGQPVAVPALTH